METMVIEKVVPGRAKKLADLKARYEERLAQKAASGRMSEMGQVYADYITDLLDALGNPEYIDFAEVAGMFAEDTGREKKSVSGSMRASLSSSSSPYVLQKNGKYLRVVRRTEEVN